MSLFTDILFISAIVLFIAGILGIFVKSISENIKLRYFFIFSILCFSLALALGWEDAVQSFQEGYNSARYNTD